MKRFLMKLLLFLGISSILIAFFLILSAQDFLSMPIAFLTDSEEYGTGNVGAEEIIPFIEKVQEKNDFSKLIIGDSLCSQVYNPFQDMNDAYCISGTNQAITLAGQYILMEEFIRNHEDVTDIYLVVIMDSLRSDLSVELGYQYMVMPFVETGTAELLNGDTKERMNDIYGRFFCRKPVVEIIDKSPLNRKLYLTFLSEKSKICPTNPNNDTIISGISYEYLEKMRSLCMEQGITFHLVPGPHADRSEQHQLEELMRAEVQKRGLEEEFGDYFDHIVYYPTELFRDRVHFDEEKIGREFFEEVIRSGMVKDMIVDEDF